jgi:TonB family protein
MSRTPDVVIVDHDLEALKRLVEPLRGEFEFYLTISGNDALTMVTRNPIGLIIAGQTLFSGSGIEVLIQARSRSPRTTRVLLANAVERKAVEGVLERAEVFQVLKRPCTAEQLREVLKAASWSARMRPEAGGPVEHVVLETGEHRSLTASASGAPVTVLTNDSGLFEAIRSAVHEHHDVHLATRESEAIELAAAGQCAVLVTDQALTQSALERATHALRSREPALVTVAAGSREQGNALMGLLGNGQIHRFLLKPVAPGLARLAIDSAARQHSSLKAHPRPEALHRTGVRHEPAHRATSQPHAAREVPTEASDFELGAPLSSTPRGGGVIDAGEPLAPPLRERPLRPWLFIAAGVLALAAVAVGTWWWFSDRTPTVDQRQVAIDRALFSAEQAYRAGRYVEPETSSALHFYEEALKLDPAQPGATAGLDRIADHYIQQAEALMVEGELEAAAAALATVRRVRPDHKRLVFLDTQLKKDQQELLLLQARQSATQGDLREAQELLSQAQQVTPGASTEVTAAQAALSERERSEQLGRLLDGARQRLAQGRLVTPSDDSAKFFVRSAQRVDSASLAVQQVAQNLRDRIVIEADTAIGARQFDAARNWIKEARDLDVDAAEVTRLQAALAAAVDQKAKGDLLALGVRRTGENRLLEPAQDSALYYLTKLHDLDPAYPGLDGAISNLGAKLVSGAQAATTQRQFENAAVLLGGATAIGYAGADLAAAETALRTARSPAPVAPRIPQPVAPKRTKYVAPKYPNDALQDGIEGWVDVSFLVSAAGDVTDARVEAAQPRARFDRAALSSVRQWKFEPRSADAVDPTLRIKTRVRFELQD